MAGFSATWLELREPVDASARNPTLDAELRAWRKPLGPLSVLDLGSGTGANLRYLAPQLRGEQRWCLVDHDATLLARGDEMVQSWPARQDLALSLQWRHMDLVKEWQALDLVTVDLVTASALMDLVSLAWLTRFTRRCRSWNAAVFIALSYDGTMDWQPSLPEDLRVCEWVNRHQRTDKGFGPALGPEATTALTVSLQELGYRILARPSPWRLGPTHTALQTALLEGWIEVVRSIAEDSIDWLDCWAVQRRRWIEQGESYLRVGHQDVFARL